MGLPIFEVHHWFVADVVSFVQRIVRRSTGLWKGHGLKSFGLAREFPACQTRAHGQIAGI